MDLLLRNFDNVMTFIINKRIDDELKTEKKKNLASICFSPYQKLGKKDQEKTFISLFKNNLQGSPVNMGNQRDMPCCPYNLGVPGLF